MKSFGILSLLSTALCLTSYEAHAMKRVRTALASEFSSSHILPTSRTLYTQGYRPPEAQKQTFTYDRIAERKVIFDKENHERFWFREEQKERKEQKAHVPDLQEKNDHTVVVDLDLKKKTIKTEEPPPNTDDPQKTKQL